MRSRATVLALAATLLAQGCKPREAPSQPEPSAPPPPPPPPAIVQKTLPEGRSAIPSFSEYASAREVTVKGSTALKCETKMIREWLRVTCRGTNDTGGTPTTVSVTRGGRGETIPFAAAGVTNLITPVLEGTDFEATFSWTDKSHTLSVKWPHGSKKPLVVGEFLGAASPLNGTAPSAVLCDCHKRLTHATDCAEAPMAQPDCERTHPGNCEKLLACARGQISAAPECLSNKRNVGITGWCAPICGPGKPPCTGGTDCTQDFGDPPVCL